MIGNIDESHGALGRVLVLGLGKSGKSAARYCADLIGTRVTSLFIAAGAQTPESQAFCEELAGSHTSSQVSYAFGDSALDDIEDRFDLCIASPGIPFWHGLYRQGSDLSTELISEVEFAWRESDPDSIWVAITGTNGKTTTTACTAHVLRECGFAARAVGNIGDVCLDAVAARDTYIYVAEVSSYQLASCPTFSPDIAVMLNITPDHLHWHRTLEAYAQAKLSLLDNLTESHRNTLQRRSRAASASGRPVAILDAVNDTVRAKVRELRALEDDERGFDYIPVGTADGYASDMRMKCGATNAAFIDSGDSGRLKVAFSGREHELVACDDLQIKGEHNAANALFAATVAVVLGADDAEISHALSTFQPLEHRIEPCGTVNGVSCFNDSKATNVDATLKALASFPGRPLAILLGGDDKGTDLSDLIDAVYAHARVAVCYGEAGPRFSQAFEDAADQAPDGFVKLEAEHLEGALDAALGKSGEGWVLLLSPACASFDEFSSFEERGSVFKELVAQHMEEQAKEQAVVQPYGQADAVSR